MTEPLYKTGTVLKRRLQVRYPAGHGRIVLRTELDWDKDVEPVGVEDDGTTYLFALEAKRPFLYVKPCLRDGQGRLHWAQGPNKLVVMTGPGNRPPLFPYFFSTDRGRFLDVIEHPSPILGRPHKVRIYVPPGYEENTLKRYPVLYMQDGTNLFFPEEAFLGRTWGVGEALELLDKMHIIEGTLVVGIHAQDRMEEYTKPGYEAYGRSVVEEICPVIKAKARTLGVPEGTGVIGSSLGGVVSFYMAWQWPEVFGNAACMSSTFSFKDDLIERVLSEPHRPVNFYLDSGWPQDNSETTAAMAVALSQRGWVFGHDLLHVGFPLDGHNEKAWGKRLHLPLQFFAGRVRAGMPAQTA
jgi:predicted alpha/beta superfamily hydrolase